MPIQSPVGTLDFVNARIGAAEIRATSNIGVANVAPTKQFSVGDKFHVSTTDADAVTISGNVVANVVKIGSLEIVPSYDFAAVSNVGNTTSNIIQFANATTGFTTTANVEIGGNITLTANAQVKVGSNVLAEYTGPHGRDPKEVPLKKYPEIAFDDGKFEYNADRTVFTQAGYIISQSEKYNSSTSYPAAYLFDDNLLTSASAWVSKYGTFGTGTGTVGEMAATNFSSFNPGTGAINGPWVKIQLPTAIKLSRINIHRWSGSAHNALPGDVTLYGSNNGTTYSQIGSTFTNLYNTLLTINNMNLNVTTTDYYKYYVLHFTSTYQSNINSALYVAVQELKFYGYEEDPPVGDLSLDTTLKSTFNSVQSNNYVMYFDGEGFDPNDANSNNLVDNSSTSVIHHNATYDSTDKYWTLDGSTESNVTTGDLGFEGDVPHTVSMWVNSSNLDANALTQQLFSIGSGYDKSFLKVDDTQIAANTWHNVTYAYQGEGGSKVTYVDGRKVEEAQVEDTFGDYPPFAMTAHETGGYRVSASSESMSIRASWKAFNDVQNISNTTEDNWESGAKYSSVSPYNANQTTYITDTNGTTHYGEWIAIEMPEKLKFGYFNMVSPVANRRPDSMVIVGSNDGGVTFDHIKTISSVTYPSNNTTTIVVNSAYAYNKFYFIVTSVDGADTVMNISHLAIYSHKEGDLTRFPEPTRVLKYPHVSLSGPAQRGYVASASSNFDTYNPWEAFDNNTGGGWISVGGSNYNDGSGSGAYSKSPGSLLGTISDTSTEIRDGEFLQIETPHKITVNHILLSSGSSDGPTDFKFWGSNDGSVWSLLHTETNHTNATSAQVDINSSVAYKYHAIVVSKTRRTTQGDYVNIRELELFGTEEDTGTPAIVGGPFAGKVANFRVYDKYLGEERIQEIYDAQKDVFGHKKSSMTFYKGRIGVGTTEPEGALTVVDEPHALAKFPARAISADDSYVEEDGQIKLSAADGSGYQAFDGLTSTSWTAEPERHTRLSEEVDFGAWLKMETPESMSLKKAEFESNPDWRQVGNEVLGSNAGDHFGRSVACSHDGTRVIAGGFPYNTYQGLAQVYDWNGSAWTQVGQTLTGTASGDYFSKFVAISGDGNIIAIAAPFEHHATGNVSDVGAVRVYYLNGGQWTVLPDSGTNTADANSGMSDIFVGSTANAYLGNGAIQLSYDGKTIAMCEYSYSSGAGRVLVYKYSNGAWSYKGTGATQFVGSAAGVHFGFGLSMSEDGNCLAIGTYAAGWFVEVYTWDGSTWNLKGSRINQPSTSTGANDNFGSVVSVSNDGNTLAIGAEDADLADGALADNSGLVFVYHWTGSAWGTPHKLTYNETDNEAFGTGVVLSGDGKRLVVSAPDQPVGAPAGELFTFEYTGGSWIMRTPGVQGLDGDATDQGHLGWGWHLGGHAFALSRDGSSIVAGELGDDGGGINAGRFRVFSMPSNIKSIWGSNDDTNWTKITTAPTREEATSNVAGLAFGYDDRLEFKNLDNPNYYKYHAIVADAFTRLKDVKLFGVRKQGSSTLHDGALTLTKNLDVPRIGAPPDADDTPRRDRLVVEYNTSTNPLEDGGVRDTSGRGFDGIFKGTATYDSNDKNITFPADSDRIETGAVLDGIKLQNTNTVSLWVKCNNPTTWEAICIIGEDTSRKHMGLWVRDATSVGVHSDYALSGNGGNYEYEVGDMKQWNHITVVRYGISFEDHHVYVNGVKVGASASTSKTDGGFDLNKKTHLTLGTSARGLYGSAQAQNYHLDGSISNFKLYDTALTAQEVKTLYDMGRCDEGHHVVNFSKTRVGIGLGDGEAPQAVLDVRGDARTTKLSVYDVSSNLTAASITTNSSGVTNETSFSVLDMKDVYGAGGYIRGFHNPYVSNGLQLGAWSLGARTNELMTILATGNVGVGTTSPGRKLEVYTGNGAVPGLRLRRYPTGATYTDFQHADSSSPANSKEGLAITVGDGNVTAQEVMRVCGDGNVGIRTNSPNHPLSVFGNDGSVGGTANRTWFQPNSTSALSYDSSVSSGNVGVYAEDYFMSSTGFLAQNGTSSGSDYRIKKDIVDADDLVALETLRLLKPKQYKYKDEKGRGTVPVWGFIAQEVAETLPYSITLTKEFIPNIYEMANVSDSNVITFTNFNTSNLESNASTIRSYGKDDAMRLLKITEVVDDHSVRVEEDLSEWTGSVDETGNVVAGNQLFVYGEEIDDFHFLKKDAIWTVATSALQEVDRQLQAEKAKVATLETQVADLLARVQTLESA